LIQESWLTPANLFKINNFSPIYSSFGISAMSSAVSKGILRGRPFGGVHILVKSDLCKFIRHVYCSERFVVLVYKNLVIVNVYLPTVVNADDECRLVDLLTNIQDAVEVAMSTVRNPYLICGGDFNADFDSNSRASVLLHCFSKRWSLSLCNKLLRGNIDYSYYHESLQQRSLIDYFLIPNSCWLESYQVLDSPLNLSDHLCIEISVRMMSHWTNGLSVSDTPPVPKNNYISRDWSVKNRRLYYEQTRLYFDTICDRINNLNINIEAFNESNNSATSSHIDLIYSDIVSSLLAAADDVMPVVRPNMRKHWWDDSLTVLKTYSIEAHSNWVASGRPTHGTVFMEKQKAKLLYKKRIAENKKKCEDNISESLQNKMLDSDQISFWKIWKKEFGLKSKNSVCIDGLSDDTCIANHFADTFASTCRTSDRYKINAENERTTFIRRLVNYRGASFDSEEVCNIENIEKAVDKLNNGKAAGYDLLTAEHLKYCHPIVWSCFSKLFSVMLKYSYVPEAFGIGITVPILKSDSKGSNSVSSAYRGITIMPVISKLFEIILLNILNPYLNSCNSQFGFKKGHSCSHAVYSVRKTVDYFTNLNSTVNLCTLDISKAFDKVNHAKLFIKMMDRNVPLNCILILSSWYEKSSICVRWGNNFSYFVFLETGVRQGSTLSPKLFALFVDDLLCYLKRSGLGCHIKGFCFNAVMYADDLLLLSISITHMQKMINICMEVLSSCQLEINASKTFGLRIGPRHNITSNCSLTVNGQQLTWKSELNYLGLYIVSSKKFRCNIQTARQKFFQATNGILGKIGIRASHNLILSLADIFCIPVLLYAFEAISLSKSDKNTLDFTYSTVFFKLFNVKEKACLKLCQFYSGCLPATCRLDIKTINFLQGLQCISGSMMSDLCYLLGCDELITLRNIYKVSERDSSLTIKLKVWKWFESELIL
jgi:hypothetical protein